MHICGGRFRFGASPLAYFEGSRAARTRMADSRGRVLGDFCVTLVSLWGQFGVTLHTFGSF